MPKSSPENSIATINSPRNLLLKFIIGGGISAVLFWLIFQHVDWPQVAQVLRQADAFWLIVTVLVYFAIYLVRTYRFTVLSPATPFSLMLCVTTIHNFLLRIMPMRTGELSYAILLKRAGTAGLGESLLSLLLLRILDSTAVVFFFVVALVADSHLYQGDRRVGVTVSAIALFVGMLAIVSMRPILIWSVRTLKNLLGALHLLKRPMINKIVEKASAIVDSFGSTTLPKLLFLSLLSLLQWLFLFLMFFTVMRTFHIPVSFAQTVLGSTAGVVVAFLPISGIGSFGTMEAAWAFGFVMVGLEKSLAVSSSLAFSLTTFVITGVIALFGWLGLCLLSRGRNPRE